MAVVVAAVVVMVMVMVQVVGLSLVLPLLVMFVGPRTLLLSMVVLTVVLWPPFRRAAGIHAVPLRGAQGRASQAHGEFSQPGLGCVTCS